MPVADCLARRVYRKPAAVSAPDLAIMQKSEQTGT